MATRASGIPWIRVGAESAAIVISILLAFSINAWWEQRQEAQEVRQILQNLQAEFTEYRGLLERGLERTSEQADDARDLAIAATTASAIPVHIMDGYLWSLFFSPTFDPPNGTRDALIASGRLELVPNPRLRSLLTGWQTTVEEVRDNQLAMRGFVLTVLTPYLAEQGVPVSRFHPEMKDDPSFPKIPEEDARQIYGRLLADPEFRTLAATRYAWFNPEEFERAIDHAEEILALTDAELVDRE